MPELVRVERLKMAYGDDVVLSGVDMSIEAGEIVTIVGPNGSGKSTLLKAMVGTELPRGGEVVRKQGLRIG